ncbi:RagB/SusD family nutrient uptake outer membrane protein [Chitinophaga arvensicola]|uniref:SusD family protein n=1 Tax=Chitinophaga arvensicola TaxID=29529 RepID=A0A1I0PLS6_9BACT|nr:RagB/SusD family nutrient uptake outer membrane protein [Chitinophaga arvensicola]SEW15384.1 SusD family protein [Chitinophaga arvensicola]
MKKIAYTIAALIIISGCKKQDEFLDKKYNLGDVVPKTLEDFQGLLNNDGVFNATYSSLGNISSDFYFLNDADYSTLQPTERNLYAWKKEIFEDGYNGDWNAAYKRIFYSNVILEKLNDVVKSQDNDIQYNQIKGTALFMRAYSHYQLVQCFSIPYANATDESLGIPYKISSDVNIKNGRMPAKEVYNNILKDLKLAVNLLPFRASFKTQPDKNSSRALLAKIYHAIGDYNSSYYYSDTVILDNPMLIDYSTINTAPFFPFSSLIKTNPEILFYASNSSYRILGPFGPAQVDSNLYRSFSNDDLRKTLYYMNNAITNNRIVYRGSYAGGAQFGGLLTSEMYFIKAEASIRKGRVEEGISLLNKLLLTRFKPGRFTPYGILSSAEALKILFREKGLELSFVGQVRWEDLRRLNTEPTYSSILRRRISNVDYELAPNSPRYALPIPNSELQINNLPQNPR